MGVFWFFGHTCSFSYPRGCLTKIYRTSTLVFKQTCMSREAHFKKELIRVLTGIRNPQVMQAFLADILTPTEFTEIAKRLELVRQLDLGVSQHEIAHALHMGVATITRGSLVLQKKRDGFHQVLKQFFRNNTYAA